MKSQKYSKNKSVASADLRRSFIENIPVPVILFLLVSAICAKTLKSVIDIYKAQGAAESSYRTLYASATADEVTFFEILFVLLGAAAAAYAFRFINIKNRSNVYFSLNLTREQLFKNRCIACLSLLCAAIIVPSAVLLAANLYTCTVKAFVISAMLYQAIGFCTLVAAGFAIGLIAAILTGSVGESIFYSIILLTSTITIPFGIDFLSSSLLEGKTMILAFSPGTYPCFLSSMTLVEKYPIISPFFLLTRLGTHDINTPGVLRYSGPYSEEIIKPDVYDWIPVMVWIAVCAVILVAAKRIFDRRKIENTGSVGGNKVLTGLTSFIFCLLTFSGTVYGFARYLQKTALGALAGTGAAVVVFIVCELLMHRNIKDFKKSLWRLPAYAAIIAIVSVIFATGGLGYSKRIPDIEDIEQVRITPAFGDGTIYADGTGGLICDYPDTDILFHSFTEEKDIKSAVEIHRLITESDNGNSSGRVIAIVYTLKDGSTVERSFYDVDKSIVNKMTSLLNSEANKDYLKKLLTYSESEFNKLVDEHPEILDKTHNGYLVAEASNDFKKFFQTTRLILFSKDGNYCEDMLKTLSKDEFAQFKKCLYNDLSKMSADDIIRPKQEALCSVEFLWEHYYEIEDSSGERLEFFAQDSYTPDFVIYPSMKETVSFLEKHGFSEAMTGSRKVAQVTVYNYEKQLENNLNLLKKHGNPGFHNPSAFFKPFTGRFENPAVYHPEDEYKLKAFSGNEAYTIQKICYPLYYTDYVGYTVSIKYTDGYEQLLFMPKSLAPDFVTAK